MTNDGYLGLGVDYYVLKYNCFKKLVQLIHKRFEKQFQNVKTMQLTWLILLKFVYNNNSWEET